jgi:hypothetical protein
MSGKGLSVDAKNELQAQRLEEQGDTEGAARLRAVTTKKGTPAPGPVTRSGQVAKFNQAIQDADANALAAEEAGDQQLAARWHQESADQALAKKNYLIRPAGQNPDFIKLFGGEGPPTPGTAGAPGSKPNAAKPAAKAKAYAIDPATGSISIIPDMTQPEKVREAFQQAVVDGAMSPEVARAQLLKLGFKPKK